MKTFLVANLGLAPFALFWILAAWAGVGAALGLAFAAALALAAWRGRSGEFRIMEAGALVVFAAIGALGLAAPGFVAARAVPLSFAGLGALALVSVALGRPWTADYSRAAYSAEANSPLFRLVNMALSALWGAIFLIDAAALGLGLGTAATASAFAFGALASLFGPKLMIRAALRRHIAAAEAYRWPAPDFSGAADPDAFDVAVVGAGIGGLTAAAMLADAGLKVVVHEAHVVPGGFCHSFLRKARHQGRACLYRFDAGPHDFSGLFPGGPLTRTLERLGLGDAIEWRRLDHSYRLGGDPIDPPRDWREYARYLGERFPEDATGLGALFSDLRAIYDGLYSTGEKRGGIPGLPDNVDDLITLPRRHPLAMQWMDRPFAELVAKHVASPGARRALGALTGYISDGRETLTCAQMVPIFGYYFHGGYYPVGGSGRLAEALVSAIAARGGAVHMKSRVAAILVEEGRAAGLQLADGTRVKARAVVSNADVKRTFLELVAPGRLPADFRARMAAADPAPSAFMLHLGVDYVPEGRPALHIKDRIGVGVEILSKLDPSAAPEGHATVGIIKLVSHAEARQWFPAEGGEDWKAWRFSPEYEARKQRLGDEMIAAAETALPGLSQHIVYRSEASPVTYARYDLAAAGAIYGVSGAGRMKGVKSPIPGLVVAGAATHGPGVEAVVISGARAAEALVPGLLAREPAPAQSKLAAAA